MTLYYDSVCSNCGTNVSTFQQDEVITVVCGCCVHSGDTFKDAADGWEAATKKLREARCKRDLLMAERRSPANKQDEDLKAGPPKDLDE